MGLDMNSTVLNMPYILTETKAFASIGAEVKHQTEIWLAVTVYETSVRCSSEILNLVCSSFRSHCYI